MAEVDVQLHSAKVKVAAAVVEIDGQQAGEMVVEVEKQSGRVTDQIQHHDGSKGDPKLLRCLFQLLSFLD